MKKIAILLLFLLLSSSGQADWITFVWDYDPSIQIDGYKLYLKSGDQYSLLWIGANKEATVDIPHGTKGEVVCRAFKDQVESPDSVEVYIKLVGKPPK